MDNDPVNKSNEEEYQFDESENSTQFAPPSAKRPSMPAKENDSGGKRKVFIVIGVIVAIFCLYKLYGVFSAEPEKPKNEMPIPIAPVAQPIKAPVVVAPKPQPQEIGTNQESSVLQDKVGTLERIVSQVSQSNANLQDQMAGVSTSIADIQNSISSLSQQVAALAKPKPVEPEKKQVSNVKTKRSVVKKAAPVVKNMGYYVKAMIQGRAWLITPGGDTLTIAEGDNLPGYGLIGKIDPARGEVTTSSGKIIGYSSGDR